VEQLQFSNGQEEGCLLKARGLLWRICGDTEA
jgi:hypothetical protein